DFSVLEHDEAAASTGEAPRLLPLQLRRPTQRRRSLLPKLCLLLMLSCSPRDARAMLLPARAARETRTMAFDWNSVLGRLDPRKWDAAGPAGKTRDFVVRNRGAVLATAVALLVGVWSGAVMGRASATPGGGESSGGLLSAIGFGQAEAPRAA